MHSIGIGARVALFIAGGFVYQAAKPLFGYVPDWGYAAHSAIAVLCFAASLRWPPLDRGEF